jgi:hypothetical protein
VVSHLNWIQIFQFHHVSIIGYEVCMLRAASAMPFVLWLPSFPPSFSVFTLSSSALNHFACSYYECDNLFAITSPLSLSKCCWGTWSLGKTTVILLHYLYKSHNPE